jgi:hypothetical protein
MSLLTRFLRMTPRENRTELQLPEANRNAATWQP